MSHGNRRLNGGRAARRGGLIVLLGLAGWLAAGPPPASPAALAAAGGCSTASGVTTCTYTPSSAAAPESLTIPAGIKANVTVAGGSGGSYVQGTPGGLGASVSATLSLSGATTLAVSAGSAGAPASFPCITGSGAGGQADDVHRNGGAGGPCTGGGGGAASGLYLGSDFGTPLIIAAGGGGAGNCAAGGNADTSGPNGGAGSSSTGSGAGGTGATTQGPGAGGGGQPSGSAGGSDGTGGAGSGGAGGGGGGFYGGGAGGSSSGSCLLSAYGAGGAGSSFVAGDPANYPGTLPVGTVTSIGNITYGQAAGAGDGSVTVTYPVVTDVTDCPPDEATLQGLIAGNNVLDFHLASDCTVPFTSSMEIDHAVTLDDSLSTGKLTLDGQQQTQLFHVDQNQSLTLDTVTLTNGLSSSGGGAVYARGALTLRNTTVSSSMASCGNGCSPAGGGIYIDSAGSLDAQDSTITGNTAACTDAHCVAVQGGGIWNQSGQVTLTGSTVSGNAATCDAGGCGTLHGGGVGAEQGSTNFTNSTVAGNSVTCTGGSCAGTAGGGVEINSGTGALSFSTIAENSSAGGSGGLQVDPGSTVTLDGTLVGNNTASGTPSDCAASAGTLADGTNGHNLIGSGTGCDAVVNGQNGDIAGMDPQLDPFGPQPNGGRTPTVALLPGSPAIGAGPALASCPAFDQRGVPPSAPNNCDIGAYQTVTQDLGCPTGDSLAQEMTALTGVRHIVTLECSTANNDITATPPQFNQAWLTFTQNVDLDGSKSPAPIILDGNSNTPVLDILNPADVSLYGLTVANGSNDPSGSGGGGAGQNLGFLTIRNTTFTNNAAAAAGGILNLNALVVRNSTFSGNTAPQGGGAIVSAGASAELTGDTFAGNTGIALAQSGGTFTVRSTLLANQAAGGNCTGIITDGGSNAADDSTCGFTDGQNGDHIAADLHLGALGNWGGPTQTIPLLAGSPAIGASVPTACGPVDQRGFYRHTSSCDIGAFESGSRVAYPFFSGLPTITNITPNTVQAGGKSVTLTIEGRNFGMAGGSVFIGGTQYTPSSWGDGSITINFDPSALLPAVQEVRVEDANHRSSFLMPLPLTAAPAGVSALSSDTSQAGISGATGQLSASQSGGGGYIELIQYTGNPTFAALDHGQDYFDVHLAYSLMPNSVTITDCTPSNQSLLWINPKYGQWAKVGGTTSSNGCLVATITSSTRPSITDLSGAVFAGSTSSSPTRAAVAAVHLRHTGRTSLLRWRMANQAGVIGFRIFGRGHVLTPGLIPVHASSQYTYRTTSPGPYRLQVIMRNGGRSSIAIR